ncbi:MAG: hypothetical protein D6722_00505 [Bacteroidetes bacterium]|nr:MAG: hypothetical protein D6722_00505 [Bacteroidota bacterium]
MTPSPLVGQIEQILDFRFKSVLDIHAHFEDPKAYPKSYRDVMTWQQEMVRDGHGGKAFVDAQGRLLGLNLYGCRERLDPQRIQALLALALPDLLALNLNETGLTHFTFTAR